MKETELQLYVVKLVKERGGAAQKLTNAFTVGVCDLLIKLPDMAFGRPVGPRYPAMLIEVKQRRMQRLPGRPFKLDVTVPQRQFLKRFQDAGMRVGVLSFLQPHGTMRRLCAAMFELDVLERCGYAALSQDHQDLGNPHARDDILYDLLTEYAK